MIVVNNPAAFEGGALSILMDVIHILERKRLPALVITSSSVVVQRVKECLNVRVLQVGRQDQYARIMWDCHVFEDLLNTHNLVPSLLISLQNTMPRYRGKCVRLLYLHQSIPISAMNWSVWSSRTRKFWFYKNIYPLFMRRNLSPDVYFMCQGRWMAAPFASLLDVNVERFLISRPIFLRDSQESLSFGEERVHGLLFYPAFDYEYKNHDLIVDAVSYMVENDMASADLKVVFTLPEGGGYIWEKVQNLGLQAYFKFVGSLSRLEVLKYMQRAHMLLFPSVMETFGLPLLEMAERGGSIVALDMPYARELVGGYAGATLLPNLASVWAEKISDLLLMHPVSFPGLDVGEFRGEAWDVLENFMEKYI